MQVYSHSDRSAITVPYSQKIALLQKGTDQFLFTGVNSNRVFLAPNTKTLARDIQGAKLGNRQLHIRE